MATAQQYAFPGRVRFLSTQPKQSELSLCPYTRVHGEWTLPDQTVLAVAHQSITDGTFRHVFLEGDVQDRDEFLMMMQNPANTPVFAFRGLDVIGCAWLNHISLHRAFAHFLFLRSCWGKHTIDAGRMIIDYWMSFTRDDGSPVFDVLLGAIPSRNRRAVQFSRRIGAHVVGRVPRMMIDAYDNGARVDADLLYVSRY